MGLAALPAQQGQDAAVAGRGPDLVPLTDYVPAVARFALHGDDRRLNALIGDLVAQGWVSDALVTHLLEPTARALGDAESIFKAGGTPVGSENATNHESRAFAPVAPG